MVLSNDLIKVRNSLGMEVSFSPIGAAIYDVFIPTKNGLIPVTVHPKTIEAFNSSASYAGKTIGRNAGRIRFGTFFISGRKYQIGNQKDCALHGGSDGFAFKYFHFRRRINKNAHIITFKYESPNGESGYPGTVSFQVTYRIPHLSNQIDIIYQAVSTHDTVINVTNHTYWNLNGNGQILDHLLKIRAGKYAEIDEYLCPLTIRQISPIMDFSMPRPIGSNINHESLQATNGFNHPYILDENNQDGQPVATLLGDISRIQLMLYSDYPTLVIYSHNVVGDEMNFSRKELN